MNRTIIFILLILTLSGCSSAPSFSSKDTALLVIDIQNAYLPVSNQGIFIQNVASLIGKAREKNIPVIYVRNIERAVPEGSKGWKFHAGVRPEEEDLIVEKEYPSSFSGTDLNLILQEMGIETLILTGLASSACYGATVRDAYSHQYRTVVVSDGHADQIRGRAEDLNTALANYENILIIKTEDIRFSSR